MKKGEFSKHSPCIDGKPPVQAPDGHFASLVSHVSVKMELEGGRLRGAYNEKGPKGAAPSIALSIQAQCWTRTRVRGRDTSLRFLGPDTTHERCRDFEFSALRAEENLTISIQFTWHNVTTHLLYMRILFFCIQCSATSLPQFLHAGLPLCYHTFHLLLTFTLNK